jgi:hypothetical protein
MITVLIMTVNELSIVSIAGYVMPYKQKQVTSRGCGIVRSLRATLLFFIVPNCITDAFLQMKAIAHLQRLCISHCIVLCSADILQEGMLRPNAWVVETAA